MNAVGSPLSRCYLGWIHALRYVQPVFLLLLRLMIGWGFVYAGWGKLSDPPSAAQRFAEYGVPLPMMNAYAAGTTETVCGLLLMLGFASRIITIPLLGTMVAAYATAHKDVFDGMWTDPGGYVIRFCAAPAFPYLIVVLMVLLFGPGVLSVDGVLKRYSFDRKCCTADARGPDADAPA